MSKWIRWEMEQRGRTRFMVTDPDGFHRFLGFSEAEAAKELREMRRVRGMSRQEYAEYMAVETYDEFA